MSDLEKEDSHVEAMDELNIATLRQVAKFLGIASQRSWDKEDYIKAIKLKQQNNSIASLVLDDGDAPKPGYARIVLHRDPTPGHKNTPVHVGLNGKMYQIPRGIKVDLPREYLNVLKDAVYDVLRDEDGDPRLGAPKERWEETMSYPFQVIAVTPGDAFSNARDSRSGTYKIRKAFFDQFGAWPTGAELADYRKNIYEKSSK